MNITKFVFNKQFYEFYLFSLEVYAELHINKCSLSSVSSKYFYMYGKLSIQDSKHFTKCCSLLCSCRVWIYKLVCIGSKRVFSLLEKEEMRKDTIRPPILAKKPQHIFSGKFLIYCPIPPIKHRFNVTTSVDISPVARGAISWNCRCERQKSWNVWYLFVNLIRKHFGNRTCINVKWPIFCGRLLNKRVG